MALTQRLQLRQSQALVMTPQLMQAIKLLQLSNLDLAAYVDAELERNPLLDRGSEGETVAAEPAEPAPPQEAATTDAWGSVDAGAEAQDGQPQPAFDDSAAGESEPIQPRAELPAGYSE